MRALVQRVSQAAVDVEGERVAQIGPGMLVLLGVSREDDARKGNPPSYGAAAPGELAEPLYDRFCERLGAKKGVFGACMGVALVNDGPVTLMLEA
ncbi:MAG TPA: D-aminoacyl-tRNA deacylase [Solirubrobacterales bacterium]